MFEGDKIKLDIAAEGVALENGWTITPYTHPGVSLTDTTTETKALNWLDSLSFQQITRDQVDHFVPGSQLPSCQLYVKWSGRLGMPKELLHKVTLQGAKESHNWILLQPPLG